MKLFFLSGLLLTSVTSWAAIPKESRAYEILQMPKEKQESAIETSAAPVYGEFIKLAFDSELNMSMRWKALMAAARIRKEKATADLVKASKDSQWYMRNAAMLALAEYNPNESEKVAKNLVKDKALVVRSAAVDVLAKSTDPESRRLLWQELNKDYNFKYSQSLWIRPQIVAILSAKPSDKELSSFALLLKESDINIQLLAIQGLEKITGVKLGTTQTPPAQLVQLWKDYKVN